MNARAATDFHQVPDQAEARYVGDRVDCVHGRKSDARRVEPGRGIDELTVCCAAQLTLLERGAHDADPQGLPEYHYVTGARTVITRHAIGVHEPKCNETIDRFRRVDGMSTGDRDPGRIAHGLSTRNHALDRLHAHFADG